MPNLQLSGGGPGLPIFTPSIYYYLATGDTDAVRQRMTLNDCSLRMQSYIDEVGEIKVILLFNVQSQFKNFKTGTPISPCKMDS